MTNHRPVAVGVTYRRELDQSVTFVILTQTGAHQAPADRPSNFDQDVTPSTVTARRFCDQQEMSLQTATGRSLP